jgi:hypothetical protein
MHIDKHFSPPAFPSKELYLFYSDQTQTDVEIAK